MSFALCTVAFVLCSGQHQAAKSACTSTWCHRTFREAAVRAFSCITLPPAGLSVGPHARLASRLLEEMLQGQERMSIHIWGPPSLVLADLPRFLARTSISELSLDAWNSDTAADVNFVLQQCSGIRSLVCTAGFVVYHWPQSMVSLKLDCMLCACWTSFEAVAAMQHRQLTNLQHAAKLQQLELRTGTFCKWPASLQSILPASLQRVTVNISVVADLCSIDLSAFTLAAGCVAQLYVKVAVSCFPFADKNLSALIALARFSLLQVDCLADVVNHLTPLQQVQCDRLILGLQSGSSDGRDRLICLPAVKHLTVFANFSHFSHRARPLIAWPDLASPGLRCLGTADFPVHRLGVEGCDGLPEHGAAWALVIWGDLKGVRGLPLMLCGGGTWQACVAQCSRQGHGCVTDAACQLWLVCALVRGSSAHCVRVNQRVNEHCQLSRPSVHRWPDIILTSDIVWTSAGSAATEVRCCHTLV